MEKVDAITQFQYRRHAQLIGESVVKKLLATAPPGSMSDKWAAIDAQSAAHLAFLAHPELREPEAK